MNTLHVGITGTRSGMTEYQTVTVINFLMAAFEPNAVFHHGDCLGADVETATIAKELGYKIVGHPPVKTEFRGYFEDDVTHTAKGYFVRNRNIVNSSFVMIVVPWQMEHANNGGTWFTHDYAEKLKKPIFVAWPRKQ